MDKVMLNAGSLPMAATLLKMFAVGQEVCVTTGVRADRRKLRGKVLKVRGAILFILPALYEDEDPEGIPVQITDICQMESGGQVIEFKVGVEAYSC